jgi:protoporphyrin/coproporphyrin ferrochelatase
MKTAVLLMAYGTPGHRDEIEAYYTDIRRGRPPTPEQLEDLVRRYDALGGTSPLAARTEAQRAGLQAALDRRAPARYEVVLGLKHASPKVEEAVADLAARGFTQVIGLVLAPHYSTRSIAEYLGRARAEADTHEGVTIRGIDTWHDEPAYIEFLARGVRAKLTTLPANTKVVFTAHSIPQRAVAEGDPYADQLLNTATLVAAAIGLEPHQWMTGWQSAGRTPEPWLGPDILDVLDELATTHAGALVCPCGFVADHLEVLFDLDIEASGRATSAGLAFARTPSMNDDAIVLDALAQRVITAALL